MTRTYLIVGTVTAALAAAISWPPGAGVSHGSPVDAGGPDPATDDRSAPEVPPVPAVDLANVNGTPPQRDENPAPTAMSSRWPPPMAAAAEPPPAPGPPGAPDDAAAMRREVDRLRLELGLQQSRVAVVEAGIADERARRWQEADEAATRQRELAAMTSDLADVERTLSTGYRYVSDDLARAQATAGRVAWSASASGAAAESALASDAQRWIAASEQALGRGDLYLARVALLRARTASSAAAAVASIRSGSP